MAFSILLPVIALPPYFHTAVVFWLRWFAFIPLQGLLKKGYNPRFLPTMVPCSSFTIAGSIRRPGPPSLLPMP
nr:hypothetical protein Q903MT_gene2952 [Picea sitchensis]